MKVLFVFRANSKRLMSVFVKEQARALRNSGIDVHYFPIIGKGPWGYLKNIPRLRRRVNKGGYDVIHGHFLWSIALGLFCSNVRIVGTFHGCDLNQRLLRLVSILFVMPFLDAVIVVNKHMAKWSSDGKSHVIPCGVDTDTFYQYYNTDATLPQINRTYDGLRLILFSSSFSRVVKNYPLARQAISMIGQKRQVELIELKDFSRKEVAEYLNKVDLLLLTSFSEGSPQIVKEAMACNTPIVSVDVGDVRWLLDGLDGCYVTSHEPTEVASAISKALDFSGRTKGRERLIELGLDSESVAKKIIGVYEEVLRKSVKISK